MDFMPSQLRQRTSRRYNGPRKAKSQSELRRVTYGWTRDELRVIDEMVYGAMSEAAAELLFFRSSQAGRSGPP